MHKKFVLLKDKKMNGQYKIILSLPACIECKYRSVCFLQYISMQKYSQQVQNFLTYVLNTSFMYQEEKRLWTSNHRFIQEQLVRYYDVYNCELIGNGKPFLTNKGQRENDKQKIRELFKQMLDIAAKTTEEKNPEISIMFDEIGLVLASDYVEAVSKIFSMLKTAIKSDNYFSGGCSGY